MRARRLLALGVLAACGPPPGTYPGPHGVIYMDDVAPPELPPFPTVTITRVSDLGQAGFVLGGYVTAADGGEAYPLPGASVWVGRLRPGLPGSRYVTTDEEGRFVLDSLSAADTVTVEFGLASTYGTVRVWAAVQGLRRP